MADKTYKFERFYDMPMGGNDDGESVPLIWGKVLGTIVRGFLKVAFKFKVENKATVNAFKGKKVGAVLVAPHVSYFDVIILWESVRPEQFVRIIARDTLFEAAHGALGALLSRCGAFPIQRNEADRLAIKRATHMLKTDQLVGIFPEGTRRGKGNTQPELHGGAALIARMAKAPLIPVGLVNLDKVMPKGDHLHFPDITVVFGDPVAVSAFDFLDKEDRLEGCVWYIMREAHALSRNCAPEDIDMTQLFPDAKDYTQAFAGREIPTVDVAALPDWTGEKKAK